MQKISVRELLKLLLVFLKIGAFTIGGGLAMIPVIKHEMVDKQGWLNEEEIVDVFAISQSLPGIISVNSSIFLGYKMAGLIGALVAAVGIILPSFIIILSIFFIFKELTPNEYVQKAFAGVRAGIAAMICVTLYNMSKTTMKDVYSFIIAALVFVLLIVFKTDIAFLMLGSGILGYVIYMAKEKLNSPKGGNR